MRLPDRYARRYLMQRDAEPTRPRNIEAGRVLLKAADELIDALVAENAALREERDELVNLAVSRGDDAASYRRLFRLALGHAHQLQHELGEVKRRYYHLLDAHRESSPVSRKAAA
jgi:hypothetical protein